MILNLELKSTLPGAESDFVRTVTNDPISMSFCMIYLLSFKHTVEYDP